MSPIATPSVPVSWGELLDKLTILEIKGERLNDAEARAHVEKEHRLLHDAAADILRLEPVAALFARLKRINEALWDIEDAIRAQESDARFGARFVALARSVYKTNDERAAIKRQINALLNSELVEEKSYAGSGGALPLTVEPAD